MFHLDKWEDVTWTPGNKKKIEGGMILQGEVKFY
jgi:hypothetical protein